MAAAWAQKAFACPNLLPHQEDYLVSRIANICHLRGYKWNITETNPPNDTAGGGSGPKGLSDAAAWSRVWNKKEIRCVKLIAKLG